MASSRIPFWWEEPSVRTWGTQQSFELNSFGLGDLRQDIPSDTSLQMDWIQGATKPFGFVSVNSGLANLALVRSCLPGAMGVAVGGTMVLAEPQAVLPEMLTVFVPLLAMTPVGSPGH